MSMTEKAAYLKGLADGMKLDESENTGKLLKAIIDTIGEMAATVDDIDDDLDVFAEQLDAVDEDLADAEEYLYDSFDDYDGFDDEYDDEDDEYDDGLYEVECPECGEVITVDEEIAAEGQIECPNCGTFLEFSFDDEDEDAE